MALSIFNRTTVLTVVFNDKVMSMFIDKETYDNFNIKSILIDIHNDIFSSIDEFWCALDEYDKLYLCNAESKNEKLYVVSSVTEN